MPPFLMPALGADMESGRVVEWKLRSGDRVRPGDVVAVVETHKGAIDVECFLDGVIEALVPVGSEWPVGAVLAQVRGVAAPATPVVVPPPPIVVPVAAAAPRSPVPAVAAPPSASRSRVSPAARRRAAELGVDADALTGSGPAGSVVLADVERAPVRRPAARGFDPAQMRAAIAAAMGRSKREIPHYYLSETLDFGAAAAWLEAWNAGHDPADRLLPAVLLLKATARALAAEPALNGFWQDGAFRPGPGVHVGWAIALRGGGLIAPAIHDADRQDLASLMRRLRDLVGRARSGGLRSSELTDPTVTVTSLGERGAESVFGVIYPPQVAIVGFGRIVERPAVRDGQLAVRPQVTVTLAADHRASDGHGGGRLLAAIDRALQDPATL